MKRNVLYLSALLGLAGCAGTQQYGEDSPYYAFPRGARLTLNKALTIPADEASARLQFGGIVARNGVEEIEPHCIFEIDTVGTGPQTVQPETFSVARISRHVSSISGIAAGQFASGRGRPSHLYYMTRFSLRSERQPQVRSLLCQSNQEAPGIAIPRYLTLAEMRRALGEWFRLDQP